MPTPYPSTLLMTADTVGGVWTYALELTRGLAPHGTHVHLATMGAPLSAAQWQQAAARPNLTIHESTYQLEWMDNPWDDVARAEQWLLQLCKELQPDLVHLNGLVHGHLNWGRPALVVVHSCVLSWWQAVKGEAAPASWDRYREAVRRSLQAADLVVAPTAALLAEAADLYGPFRQQGVVYNGLNPQAFHTAPKELFIFSMGRVWDEAKNLSLLAEVAAQLSWPVYIAGNAQHPATGQALSLPNVQFLGQLTATEAAEWLSRTAIYVMPAKYEPFGLTLLEAAFSGCVLVAGDIATLREVWGEAACYVNPQEGSSLVSSIEALIKNPLLRQQLAASATQRATRYTTEQMVAGYGKLYQQLLGAAVPIAADFST
jgi:glycosyltransferase involved in cell wall biosynthesis